MRILLLLAVMLLAATPAFAATAESPSRMSAVPSVENMSTEQCLAWHDGVRRDISAGRYGKLDNRTVETIDAQENLIHARLHDGKQLSDLSESARLDVFNAH